jgi:DNA-binding transcriptional LysR family regulator
LRGIQRVGNALQVQTPFFARKGRRLSPTPAGQSMLTHAREILAVNDRAVQALREIAPS